MIDVDAISTHNRIYSSAQVYINIVKVMRSWTYSLIWQLNSDHCDARTTNYQVFGHCAMFPSIRDHVLLSSTVRTRGRIVAIHHCGDRWSHCRSYALFSLIYLLMMVQFKPNCTFTKLVNRLSLEKKNLRFGNRAWLLISHFPLVR